MAVTGKFLGYPAAVITTMSGRGKRFGGCPAEMMFIKAVLSGRLPLHYKARSRRNENQDDLTYQ